MRLTLRTMLAYMDGILEPEDADDIKKKIEESEYATNLLHRTRDVMRRLRLAAPGLSDEGQKLDANTVAEYLDNTLDGQRVADFEKVCLDSDIHLAEVSSGHQILTLVLGEPAEIDSASRERMYRLIEQLDSEAEPEKPPVQRAVAGTKTPRPRPTVPDYLREPPRRRRWPQTAAALVLVAGLVLVVLTAFGQFERDSTLMKLLGFGLAQRPIAERPADQPTEPALPAEEPQPPDAGVAEMPETPETDVTPGGEDTEPISVGEPAEPPVAPQPPVPVPDETPAPADPPREPGPVEPDPDSDAEPAVPGEPPSAETTGPQLMGKVTSEQQVLLRFDAESDTWQRVPLLTVVNSSRRLLALPTYRPLIALTTGVTVELIGGTEIELLPVDAGGTAGLKIVFGRVILRTAGKANVRMRLQVGRQTGVITFVDPESAAAVEVTSLLIPGTNPTTEPAALTTYVYAATGQLLWDEADRQTVAVGARQCLAMSGQAAAAPVAVEQFPAWVTSVSLGVWDNLASPVLERTIGPDRSADLSLIELANHRRTEVAWLAARCLGYIGQPESMVAVLNEVADKQLWPKCIERLHQAVARGPEAAGAIHQALKRQYAQDADDMYRMLWNYTQKDLDGGEAARLVNHLEHDTLAVRVLSFWNLKNITGWGLFYKPEQTAAKRARSVEEWRTRLDQGQIKIRPPEQPEEAPGPQEPPPPPPDEPPL